MKNLIAIVAGEPESINSEIIAKAWKKINFKNRLFIIGNYALIKKQIKQLKINVPINLIETIKEIKKKELNILNIPFSNNFSSKKKYVLDCLNLAHVLASNKEIKGFVNAPVDKKIFENKYLGVTEYLAFKNKLKKKEIMLIYNKKLSVVPLTTHIPIKDVTKKITSDLIIKKILQLILCFKKLFKKNPRIALLGLNPHNSENKINSVENKIIKPSIKHLKKLGININGPYSGDTVFMKKNRNRFDIIVGMYHDQVLTPFKTLYEFDAVNITLGLNYLRLSPDHGTAKNLVGKNRANPQSLLAAINFLNKVND